MIVAIDGPAGSGKSTVARRLAEWLGMHYLDTGAMYRSVALAAKRHGVSLDDEPAIARLAATSSIVFVHEDGASIPTRVMLDGDDVTIDIRTPEIDEAVSLVARMPRVREAMVAQQRVLGEGDDLVAEGRDIGTVVFPDADVKIYLTASAEERSKRRYTELAARGESIEAEAVFDGIIARDGADMSREAGPLAAAADARVVDTTDLSVDQVIETLVALVEEAR